MLHVSAEPVVFIRDVTSLGWNVANAIDSATRWCIGVFVMVSGALLLSPERSESASLFYAKRLRRILVPIAFWSLAYLGLASLREPDMDLESVLDRVWHGVPAYHLWYLFMVLGLYALTPLLRVWIRRAPPAARWAAIVASFSLASAYALGCAFGQWPSPNVVPFLFIPYLGYYLCGSELRSIEPGARGRWLALAVLGAAVVATVAGTRTLFAEHGPTLRGLFLYEYLSPNVIAMSIAVFVLAAGRRGAGALADDSAARRFVSRLAPLTLGIYVVHPIVIDGLRQLGIRAIEDPLLGILSVALPTFALSAALSHGFARIPGLRHSIGLG